MKITELILLLSLITTYSVFGQEIEDDQSNLSTEERVKVLSKEVEELKAGSGIIRPAEDLSVSGLGPAASKVYQSDGLSIGGYGEIHFETKADKDEAGTAQGGNRRSFDALRGILYFGYKFNDNLVLNTEIELEHANEAFLEFSYLDYMFNDAFNLRAGLILIPMGLVNEYHESPTFLSVNRPVTEKKIIPSTWRENGGGVYGRVGDLEYRAFIVTALNGYNAGTEKFNASGLRSGRQKGSEADSDQLAGVARIDYTVIPGLKLGGSFYNGNSNQSMGVSGTELGTTIMDGHLEYRANGIYARALYVTATVSGVEEMITQGLITSTNSPGTSLTGMYAELGYNILGLIAPASTQELIPFARYEMVDTQATVAASATASEAYQEQTYLTVGMHYKPAFGVAFKADVIMATNKAKTGVNSLNFGTAYLF
jgi:hypothetical protein